MINNVTGHADEAPRYVKNILARLRELQLHDREVWLKAIMLPSLAEKAIKKEFGKNDPDFDTGKHFIEEVAIINLSEFHSYFEEVE